MYPVWLQYAFRSFIRSMVSLMIGSIQLTSGPLIRLGPSEVSFYSMDIYDMIYRAGSKFQKDPVNYGGFVQSGHPSIFSIWQVEAVQHATDQ